MLLSSPALVERVEALNRDILAAFVRSQQRLAPGADFISREEDGGYAVFDLTGLESRVCPGGEDFISLVEWLRERVGAPGERHLFASERLRVVLGPSPAPGLVQALAEAGATFQHQTCVLARALEDLPPRPTGDLDIVEATSDLREICGETISKGFMGRSPTPLERLVSDAYFDMPESAHYLARRGGEYLAGGAIVALGSGALLTGLSVLEAHRGQRLQAALIARRLHDARARGADLAVMTTAPHGRSLRNAQRAGFQLVYSRISLGLPG